MRRVKKPASANAARGASAVRSARGPHAARREEAERSMILAAMRIVAERGLDDLTLAGCGEAAGYSRGLAAHYFDSKDGLIAAIAQRIVNHYVRQLREARGPDAHGLPAVLRSVAFYIDSSRKDLTTLRAFHAVLGAALKPSPVSAVVAELNRRSVDGYAAGIRHGIAHGQIRKGVDPTAQAALIVASLRGAMTLWLLDPDHIDLDAVKRELLRDLTLRLAVERSS
jgi:AcrR family transcriptional regulator